MPTARRLSRIPLLIHIAIAGLRSLNNAQLPMDVTDVPSLRSLVFAFNQRANTDPALPHDAIAQKHPDFMQILHPPGRTSAIAREILVGEVTRQLRYPCLPGFNLHSTGVPHSRHLSASTA